MSKNIPTTTTTQARTTIAETVGPYLDTVQIDGQKPGVLPDGCAAHHITIFFKDGSGIVLAPNWLTEKSRTPRSKRS